MSAQFQKSVAERSVAMAGQNRPGRPHLGARHVQTARVPTDILEALDELAAVLGYGANRSALLADLACAAVGRHDLTLRADFDVQVLPHVMEGRLPLAM